MMEFKRITLFSLLVYTLTFSYFIRAQDGVDLLLQSLESVLVDVAGENYALESKVSQLQIELKKHGKQKNALAERIIELENTIERQNSDIAVLEEMCKETMPFQKRQVLAPWVGFTAVISQANVAGLSPGQALVFDQVITNMANAYNASSGHFVAPSKGMYAFNMAILVEPGHNEYLEFVKDGSHVMYNYAHAGGSLHDVSSSRTVVLKLDAGNQVWIQTSPNGHHGSGTIHGNGFSTFSGWLLAYVEDSVSIVG